MSATTAPMTLDVAGTPRVPMSRLAKVELRKALDTRAGFWFTISILALVAVVELIYSFAADDDLSAELQLRGRPYPRKLIGKEQYRHILAGAPPLEPYSELWAELEDQLGEFFEAWRRPRQ